MSVKPAVFQGDAQSMFRLSPRLVVEDRGFTDNNDKNGSLNRPIVGHPSRGAIIANFFGSPCMPELRREQF